MEFMELHMVCILRSSSKVPPPHRKIKYPLRGCWCVEGEEEEEEEEEEGLMVDAREISSCPDFSN